MHLIDGPIVNPVSTDLSFGTINNSWDTAGWTGDPNYWGFWHAAHVAGVVGAKSNNFLLRGINPGQTIMHYGGHSNPYTVADRLNLITAYNELGYLWSVINISMNTGKDIPYTENDFEFQKDLGRMMAIASNTHLIFQSAGNNNDDACKYSFTFNGAARPYDGIMLIGGFDINGARSTDDTVVFNNGFGVGGVAGSNNGPCVELWAPSRQITSLRYNTNLTQVLSGTSFAAPIAAAIATRYGNNYTRPIEREYFLRYYAQNTGHTDGAGIPIQSVKWNSGTSNIIKRHAISNVWSPNNLSDIAILKDGNYQGTRLYRSRGD